ncbi:MAG: hypothetical protein K0R12_856 [Gammaproteobacteria bacterium]|jgi:hypothetical protein|nr:hypothetical protein [Gammaproteobacteria bacterium]
MPGIKKAEQKSSNSANGQSHLPEHLPESLIIDDEGKVVVERKSKALLEKEKLKKKGSQSSPTVLNPESVSSEVSIDYLVEDIPDAQKKLEKLKKEFSVLPDLEIVAQERKSIEAFVKTCQHIIDQEFNTTGVALDLVVNNIQDVLRDGETRLKTTWDRLNEWKTEQENKFTECCVDFEKIRETATILIRNGNTYIENKISKCKPLKEKLSDLGKLSQDVVTTFDARLTEVLTSITLVKSLIVKVQKLDETIHDINQQRDFFTSLPETQETKPIKKTGLQYVEACFGFINIVQKSKERTVLQLEKDFVNLEAAIKKLESYHTKVTVENKTTKNHQEFIADVKSSIKNLEEDLKKIPDENIKILKSNQATIITLIAQCKLGMSQMKEGVEIVKYQQFLGNIQSTLETAQDKFKETKIISEAISTVKSELASGIKAFSALDIMQEQKTKGLELLSECDDLLSTKLNPNGKYLTLEEFGELFAKVLPEIKEILEEVRQELVIGRLEFARQELLNTIDLTVKFRGTIKGLLQQIQNSGVQEAMILEIKTAEFIINRLTQFITDNLAVYNDKNTSAAVLTGRINRSKEKLLEAMQEVTNSDELKSIHKAIENIPCLQLEAAKNRLVAAIQQTVDLRKASEALLEMLPVNNRSLSEKEVYDNLDAFINQQNGFIQAIEIYLSQQLEKDELLEKITTVEARINREKAIFRQYEEDFNTTKEIKIFEEKLTNLKGELDRVNTAVSVIGENDHNSKYLTAARNALTLLDQCIAKLESQKPFTLEKWKNNQADIHQSHTAAEQHLGKAQSYLNNIALLDGLYDRKKTLEERAAGMSETMLMLENIAYNGINRQNDYAIQCFQKALLRAEEAKKQPDYDIQSFDLALIEAESAYDVLRDKIINGLMEDAVENFDNISAANHELSIIKGYPSSEAAIDAWVAKAVKKTPHQALLKKLDFFKNIFQQKVINAHEAIEDIDALDREIQTYLGNFSESLRQKLINLKKDFEGKYQEGNDLSEYKRSLWPLFCKRVLQAKGNRSVLSSSSSSEAEQYSNRQDLMELDSVSSSGFSSVEAKVSRLFLLTQEWRQLVELSNVKLYLLLTELCQLISENRYPDLHEETLTDKEILEIYQQIFQANKSLMEGGIIADSFVEEIEESLRTDIIDFTSAQESEKKTVNSLSLSLLGLPGLNEEKLPNIHTIKVVESFKSNLDDGVLEPAEGSSSVLPLSLVSQRGEKEAEDDEAGASISAERVSPSSSVEAASTEEIPIEEAEISPERLQELENSLPVPFSLLQEMMLLPTVVHMPFRGFLFPKLSPFFKLLSEETIDANAILLVVNDLIREIDSIYENSGEEEAKKVLKIIIENNQRATTKELGSKGIVAYAKILKAIVEKEVIDIETLYEKIKDVEKDMIAEDNVAPMIEYWIANQDPVFLPLLQYFPDLVNFLKQAAALKCSGKEIFALIDSKIVQAGKIPVDLSMALYLAIAQQYGKHINVKAYKEAFEWAASEHNAATSCLYISALKKESIEKYKDIKLKTVEKPQFYKEKAKEAVSLECEMLKQAINERDFMQGENEDKLKLAILKGEDWFVFVGREKGKRKERRVSIESVLNIKPSSLDDVKKLELVQNLHGKFNEIKLKHDLSQVKLTHKNLFLVDIDGTLIDNNNQFCDQLIDVLLDIQAKDTNAVFVLFSDMSLSDIVEICRCTLSDNREERQQAKTIRSRIDLLVHLFDRGLRIEGVITSMDAENHGYPGNAFKNVYLETWRKIQDVLRKQEARILLPKEKADFLQMLEELESEALKQISQGKEEVINNAAYKDYKTTVEKEGSRLRQGSAKIGMLDCLIENFNTLGKPDKIVLIDDRLGPLEACGFRMGLYNTNNPHQNISFDLAKFVETDASNQSAESLKDRHLTALELDRFSTPAEPTTEDKKILRKLKARLIAGKVIKVDMANILIELCLLCEKKFPDALKRLAVDLSKGTFGFVDKRAAYQLCVRALQFTINEKERKALKKLITTYELTSFAKAPQKSNLVTVLLNKLPPLSIADPSLLWNAVKQHKRSIVNGSGKEEWTCYDNFYNSNGSLKEEFSNLPALINIYSASQNGGEIALIERVVEEYFREEILQNDGCFRKLYPSLFQPKKERVAKSRTLPNLAQRRLQQSPEAGERTLTSVREKEELPKKASLPKSRSLPNVLTNEKSSPLIMRKLSWSGSSSSKGEIIGASPLSLPSPSSSLASTSSSDDNPSPRVIPSANGINPEPIQKPESLISKSLVQEMILLGYLIPLYCQHKAELCGEKVKKSEPEEVIVTLKNWLAKNDPVFIELLGYFPEFARFLKQLAKSEYSGKKTSELLMQKAHSSQNSLPDTTITARFREITKEYKGEINDEDFQAFNEAVYAGYHFINCCSAFENLGESPVDNAYQAIEINDSQAVNATLQAAQSNIRQFVNEIEENAIKMLNMNRLNIAILKGEDNFVFRRMIGKNKIIDETISIYSHIRVLPSTLSGLDRLATINRLVLLYGKDYDRLSSQILNSIHEEGANFANGSESLGKEKEAEKEQAAPASTMAERTALRKAAKQKTFEELEKRAKDLFSLESDFIRLNQLKDILNELDSMQHVGRREFLEKLFAQNLFGKTLFSNVDQGGFEAAFSQKLILPFLQKTADKGHFRNTEIAVFTLRLYVMCYGFEKLIALFKQQEIITIFQNLWKEESFQASLIRCLNTMIFPDDVAALFKEGRVPQNDVKMGLLATESCWPLFRMADNPYDRANSIASHSEMDPNDPKQQIDAAFHEVFKKAKETSAAIEQWQVAQACVVSSADLLDPLSHEVSIQKWEEYVNCLNQQKDEKLERAKRFQKGVNGDAFDQYRTVSHNGLYFATERNKSGILPIISVRSPESANFSNKAYSQEAATMPIPYLQTKIDYVTPLLAMMAPTAYSANVFSYVQGESSVPAFVSLGSNYKLPVFENLLNVENTFLILDEGQGVPLKVVEDRPKNEEIDIEKLKEIYTRPLIIPGEVLAKSSVTIYASDEKKNGIELQNAVTTTELLQNIFDFNPFTDEKLIAYNLTIVEVVKLPEGKKKIILHMDNLVKAIEQARQEHALWQTQVNLAKEQFLRLVEIAGPKSSLSKLEYVIQVLQQEYEAPIDQEVFVSRIFPISIFYQYAIYRGLAVLCDANAHQDLKAKALKDISDVIQWCGIPELVNALETVLETHVRGYKRSTNPEYYGKYTAGKLIQDYGLNAKKKVSSTKAENSASESEKTLAQMSQNAEIVPANGKSLGINSDLNYDPNFRLEKTKGEAWRSSLFGSNSESSFRENRGKQNQEKFEPERRELLEPNSFGKESGRASKNRYNPLSDLLNDDGDMDDNLTGSFGPEEGR